MGKRAWISLPLILVLLVGIAGSFFLMNTKVDFSKVDPGKRIGAYTKPAVVRVLDYAIVTWDYSYIFNPDVYEYMTQQEGLSYVGGSGSGAIISSNGYIVTNAHVVDATRKSDEEIITTALVNMAYDISELYGYSIDSVINYLYTYLSYTSVQKVQKVILPSGEVYDSDVKSFGAPLGEGKDVAVIKIDARNLPTLQLGDSDALELQDDVWTIGYPGAAEISEESQLVSTINDGQISAKDKKSEQGSPIIQYSAPSGPGNSGGPVVNADGKIVGLHTASDPERTGFSFAVPSSTVQEFIAQSGAKTSPGPVDTLYKEGLEFFWAGYYEEALDRFQKVQQLYDKHSEIKHLISDSQAKMSESKTYWPKYKTYFYVYDGVAAIIIIFLIVFAFVLKPKQVPQTPDSPESHPEKGTE